MKYDETERGPGYVVRKRHLACENSKFKVFLDHLDGGVDNTTPDYLVVEPKTLSADMVSGVAILPFLEEKIGLIRVYRHAIQDWSWEIPRGFIDEGETVPFAAIRELQEETGLICEPAHISSLGYITPESGVLAGRIHLFSALKCQEDRTHKMIELGHKGLHFFTRSEIALMAQNEIQDPCTLTAFFRHEFRVKAS